jgi:hypothetical protein
MALTEKIATRFPRLSRPDPEIAHPRSVRLGDAIISAEFPSLPDRDEKRPSPVKSGSPAR